MLDERLAKTESTAGAHFRARLKARDGTRPQSTLAILAGLDPRKATPDVPRGPIRMAPVHHTVRATRSVPVVMAPAVARDVRVPATPVVPVEVRREPYEVPPARAPLPVVVPPRSRTETLSTEVEEQGEERRGFAQLAFAGLAMLGLAGLAYMAVDQALNDRSGRPADDDTEALRQSASAEGPGLAGTAAVSAAAVEEASLPVGAEPTPWFDYRGVADFLKARVEAFQASEREAAQRLELDAEQIAAAALAETEAQRLAAQTQSAVDAETAAAAERARLVREEADRIAAIEAQRLADAEAAEAALRAEAERVAALEAERAAAAVAEQQRLADLEAQRIADLAARAEADRAVRQAAADAEAARLAQAESRRLAAEADARRLAETRAQQAAEAEASRLAAIEAQRAAQAAEARRLAELEAQRLAAAADAQRQAAATVTLAAVVLPPAPAIKPAVPPGAASLKPARPDVASPVLQEANLVQRAAPRSLIAANPEVRSFQAATPASPKTVDVFVGERVARTSASVLPEDGLASLKADFLRHVESSEDGAVQTLTTPDGRRLEIRFEQTINLEPVTRSYEQPAPVAVSIMCRDVAYVLPGQERGRFAACRSEGGSWELARPAGATGLG
ncbi:MAG: hypothetical protein ACK46Q_04570 [Hyphomonas sp.]